jgi:hypothetical protein
MLHTSQFDEYVGMLLEDYFQCTFFIIYALYTLVFQNVFDFNARLYAFTYTYDNNGLYM